MADAPRPRDLRSTLAARRDRQVQVPPPTELLPESPKSGLLAWFGRIALMLAVLLVPWAFGGVYTSIQFWVSVALVVALVCWWLDLGLTLRKTEFTPLVLLPLAGGILIGISQLLPLADVTAKTAAPLQQELYAAVGSAIGPEANPVFSLSLDREATWNQVRLLTLGLAGLLLGAGLFQRREDVITFLIAVTANGVALTFFAIAQKVTWNGKLYWTWAPLFGGSAFGPFINRNNAAGYLLLCLAAGIGLLIHIWNSQARTGSRPVISSEIPIWRQWQQHFLLQIAEITASKLGCLFACGFLSLGVIATLSRGGVIALLVAGILTILFYGMARKPKTGGLLVVPVLGMVVLLACWVGYFDELMERFDQARVDQVLEGDELDSRLESWKQSLSSRSSTGFFGSGLGTYPAINRMFNRQRETGITEYAENQFVQSLVDGGWPAFLMVLGGVLLTGYSSLFLLYRGFSPATLAVGGAGLFLVCSQAISGFFDFGWYIPANTLLGVVLVGMIGFQSHYLAHRLKEPSALRFHLPNWLANVASLAAFALCVLVAVDLYSVSKLDTLWMRQPTQLDYKLMPLTETSQQIDNYQALTSRRSSVWYSKIGQLYLHRARLAYFELLKSATPVETLAEPKQQQVLDNLWDLTTLSRMEEQAFMSQEQGGYAAARNFRNQPFFKDLALALECFVNSTLLRPAQPETLSRISQLQSLFSRAESSERFAQLAVRMAPTNVGLEYAAGFSSLYQRKPENAANYFRRILELVPDDYNRVVALLKGLSGRISKPLPDRMIAEKVLPANPRMLFEFATNSRVADDSLRTELLDQADRLLGELRSQSNEDRILKADISIARGDRQLAIKELEQVLVSSPYDHANRLRLAELLVEEKELRAARKHIDQLLNFDSRSAAYNGLMKKVNDLIEEERTRAESNSSN